MLVLKAKLGRANHVTCSFVMLLSLVAARLKRILKGEMFLDRRK